MTDYAAVLGAALLLALGAGAGWRALGGRPRVVPCLLLGVLTAGYGAFRFSGARTVQLFGGIVWRVETADSVVALTFDDGPLPGSTERVLRALEAEGARATFFLNGSSMVEHPEQARRIVAAGHQVGNHTWTHPRMLGLSTARIRAEIEPTDSLIRALGQAGPILFRSPYGKKLVALPWYLHRTGRTNLFWDVEPDSDPEIAGDSARIVRHVLERARPGSIVLLHVMTRHYRPGLAAVPEIVRGLKARGYRFVTVTELMQRR